MAIKDVILKYLQKSDTPLSYYQLDQLMINDKFHDLLAELSDALLELEAEGYIKAEMHDVVKHYALTNEGAKSVAGKA